MLAIAARTGSPHPCLVDAAEPPGPGAGEVLCKTLQVGVCGTDREILESTQPLTPPGKEHLILGHECLARVEQVGAEVTGVQPGDLVVPVVRRATRGRPSRVDLLPFGHYTERGIVREHGFALPWFLDRPEYLFPVAKEVSSVAVFTEPLSVAEKAVNEALAVQRGRMGEMAWTDPPPRVLVTGLGPIAFGAVIACRSRHWPVTVYGRDEETTFRVQLAQSLGAGYLGAAHYDFQPADPEREGFDLILECTGSDDLLVQASSALRACGVMVWVGSARVPRPKERNVELLMRHAILRNHVHLGTVNAAPRDFTDALRHLAQVHASQPRELAAMFTDYVPPEEALWHYEHRRPQGIKTVVVYGE